MNIPKEDLEEILLAVVNTVDPVCFANTGLKGKYACYFYWSVALIPKAYIKSLNKRKSSLQKFLLHRSQTCFYMSKTSRQLAFFRRKLASAAYIFNLIKVLFKFEWFQ